MGSALARHQGDELLIIVLVVVVGIVLVHIGASLARAAQLTPSLPAMHPVQRRVAWGAVVVALVAGATVFAASGALADRWQEFKAPPTATATNDVHRLGTFTGESRYRVWVSAFDAFKSAPVAGIGAGSFDDWWQRHATTRESLRNAHSLYAETLGELGLVGITLLLALIALIIAAGIRGVRRTTGPPPALLAGATAACAAFAVAAGIDWLWQVTVLPVCFLLLGAAVLSPGGQDRDRPPRRRGRVALVALSIVGLVALGVPLAGATQLRSSQQAAAANQLDPALRQASTSLRVQPFASSPLLQRALVMELRGDLSRRRVRGAGRGAQGAHQLAPAVRARKNRDRTWRRHRRACRAAPRAGSQQDCGLPAMTHDDFDPGIPADELEQLEQLASRLVADRPVPRPAFRGDLRRRVVRTPHARRLRLRVAAYLASGVALLAIAALGVNDVGPLAPHPVAQHDAAQAQVSAR